MSRRLWVPAAIIASSSFFRTVPVDFWKQYGSFCLAVAGALGCIVLFGFGLARLVERTVDGSVSAPPPPARPSPLPDTDHPLWDAPLDA